MRNVYTITLASLFLLAGACSKPADDASAPAEPSAAAVDEVEDAAPSSSYAEAHAAAVEAIDQAAARGHAWSTSDALLEQAITAAAEGDEDLAIQLADSARIQAELAAKQADIEEESWPERVPSD